MAVIEIARTTRLDGPIQPEGLTGVLYTTENIAHQFVISCTRNGADVALSGTVTGKFIRSADNATVPLTGSISNGKAYVTLNSSCYLYNGHFDLSIFVTENSAVTCVYAAAGHVRRTDGETTVDPSGEITIDVNTLLAAIETATASIPADYSDLLATIAGTFSSSAAYAAGDYVWYDGTLYRFTAAHAAGSWSGTDASAVVLANDLAELKSRIEVLEPAATSSDVGKALKAKTVSGGKVTEYELGEAAVIDDTLSNAGEAADAKATGDAIAALENDVDDKLNAPATAGTAGQALITDGNGGVSWADVEIEVDDTLTQQGEAADAKATGDAIDEVHSQIIDLSNAHVNLDIGTVTENVTLTSDGKGTSANNGRILTDFIPVTPGERIYISIDEQTERCAFYSTANYSDVVGDTFKISSGSPSYKDVPAGCYYVKLGWHKDHAPTALYRIAPFISDSAGAGAIDKVWSANKSATENTARSGEIAEAKTGVSAIVSKAQFEIVNATIETGYYANDGTRGSGSSYRTATTTVTAGEILKVSGYTLGYTAFSLIVYFDSNDDFLSYAYQNSGIAAEEYTDLVVTVPQGAAKIGVNCMNANKDLAIKRMANIASVSMVTDANARTDEVKRGLFSLADKNEFYTVDATIENAWYDSDGTKGSVNAYRTATATVTPNEILEITGATIKGNYWLIVWFDENDNFIKPEYKNDNTGANEYTDLPVIVPPNAHKIGVNAFGMYNSNGLSIKRSSDNAPLEKMTGLIQEVSDVSKCVNYEQVDGEYKTGFYHSGSGAWTSNSSYETLEFAAQQGDIYLITGRVPGAAGLAKVIIFDGNGTILGVIDDGSAGESATVNQYVYVPYANAAKMAVLGQTYDSADYYPRAKRGLLKYAHVKKLGVCFGDSIFGNFRPTVDIPSILSAKTSNTVLNGAFGGCRMSYFSGNYGAFSMYKLADAICTGTWTDQDAAMADPEFEPPAYAANHLANLKDTDFDDVDFITIAYGTNDWRAGKPLDDEQNPKNTNTIAGALRYSLEEIMTTYPQIDVYVLSPIWRVVALSGDTESNPTGYCDVTPNAATDPYYLMDVCDTLKKVADEYHVTFINDFDIGINQFNWKNWLKDGTHPTMNGRTLISGNMIKNIKNLLQ